MPNDNRVTGLKEPRQFASYRDLIAWQKAMDLVRLTYKSTTQLPREEQFGLRSQMRECAVSVPSNIAEGWGRETTKDYLRFLHIARASTCELSTEATLCGQLGYHGDWAGVINASEEIGRILNGLINSLRDRAADPSPLIPHSSPDP